MLERRSLLHPRPPLQEALQWQREEAREEKGVEQVAER